MSLCMQMLSCVNLPLLFSPQYTTDFEQYFCVNLSKLGPSTLILINDVKFFAPDQLLQSVLIIS